MKLPTYRRPFFDRPTNYRENLRFRVAFLVVLGITIPLFFAMWAHGDGPDRPVGVWRLLGVVFVASVSVAIFYLRLPLKRDEVAIARTVGCA